MAALVFSTILGAILPVSVASAEVPNPCQCVQFLRTAYNIPIKGDAWTLTPTHNVIYATEGDVLLTSEGPGHAALITGFVGQVDVGDYLAPQFIQVTEANYRHCQVGTRLIPWTSPEIRGVIHSSDTVTLFQRQQ